MRSSPTGRTPSDNELLPLIEPPADAQSLGSVAKLPVGDIGGAPREIWSDALHGRGESGMRRASNIFDVSAQNRAGSRGADVPLDRGQLKQD